MFFLLNSPQMDRGQSVDNFSYQNSFNLIHWLSSKLVVVSFLFLILQVHVPCHSSMIYQLNDLCETDATHFADVLFSSCMTEHMLLQQHRLSEATAANTTFVRPNIVVHPENDDYMSSEIELALHGPQNSHHMKFEFVLSGELFATNRANEGFNGIMYAPVSGQLSHGVERFKNCGKLSIHWALGNRWLIAYLCHSGRIWMDARRCGDAGA